MILYCIITYLMMLGFIIQGENLRDFSILWLIYALIGPVAIPTMLGVLIAEIVDYMRRNEKKEVSRESDATGQTCYA